MNAMREAQWLWDNMLPPNDDDEGRVREDWEENLDIVEVFGKDWLNPWLFDLIWGDPVRVKEAMQRRLDSLWEEYKSSMNYGL